MRQVIDALSQRALYVCGVILCAGLLACTAQIGDHGSTGEPDPGGGSSGPGGGPGDPGGGPGDPGGGPGDPTEDPSCERPAVAGVPMRRLSHMEYQRTLRDLFEQPELVVIDQLPDEIERRSFDTNSRNQRVPSPLANTYFDLAASVTEGAIMPLVSCSPEGEGEACATEFIDGFGMRAFRRPLTTEDQQRFVELYRRARDELSSSFERAMELVAQAMILSPHFLYRVEFGEPADAEGLQQVRGWEMASRLSYMLWGTMPDQALFEAAAAAELSTVEQIGAQARRMLEDPKAEAMLDHFAGQWLRLQEYLRKVPDESYEDYTREVQELMVEETLTFVRRAFLHGERGLDDLLTAPQSFVNGALASYYGFEASGSDFRSIDLDPTRYAGLLTQGSILANHSSGDVSPIHRGVFIHERLLCSTLAPPPADPDVPTDPPPPDPDLTDRQRLQEHTSRPYCNGCHRVVNPPGYLLGNFDNSGRYREKDFAGRTIKTRATVVQTLDVDGDYGSIVGFARALSASGQVQECVAEHWFRFAYGREVDESLDACSMRTLRDMLGSGDAASLREFLVALTTTDAFLYRTAFTPEDE